MKSVKIEEKGDLIVKKLAKKDRMSIKELVNMVLENLTHDDVVMFRERDQGVTTKRVIDESYKIESEEDEEEELDVEWEEEDDEDSEEDYEVEGFSPSEITRKRLELDAIKANIISKEEIEGYVDENYTD